MMTEFRLLQDEWIQVAPLGDHPHEQGIQRIDAMAVANMAARFNSLRARLGRVFAGAPLFEGHHDTDPEKYPNGKSFAWVMELENRGGEGLWARVKWTDEGRELVTGGKYKFVSPVWTARSIAQENGRTVFRPEALVSLALTNLPNLPLPPLANEKTNMKTLIEILELNHEASGDDICAAAETLAQARQADGERAATLAKQLATETERATAERTERIELRLENAILANRLTRAEREHWRGELERDFATADSALAQRAPRLNVAATAQTRELGNTRNQYEDEASRRAPLVAFMHEQRAKGVKQDDAWARAKIEFAEVFERMSPTPGKG